MPSTAHRTGLCQVQDVTQKKREPHSGNCAVRLRLHAWSILRHESERYIYHGDGCMLSIIFRGEVWKDSYWMKPYAHSI